MNIKIDEISDQKNNHSDIKEIETKETLLKENHEAVKENITEENQSHTKTRRQVKQEKSFTLIPVLKPP